jgi:UDP-glucose-4-epimerase GalE
MSENTILISGGAGYIGSHACYALRQAGFEPVVIDNLSTGNEWAASFGPFERGDIGDADFVRGVCDKYKPVAAMHFAAFIEVGESVINPAKYYENNRDKAWRFFKSLTAAGVKKVIFSSTAAVYGAVSGKEPITEWQTTEPINPYGQSKLEAEAFLRMLGGEGVSSVTLRYFNVAGAAPIEALIGETHAPESHLIPRLILPLINTPAEILKAFGLHGGFTIYGNDYPTPDGTAIRDYIHVMDLADAHICALRYLLEGGETEIFNLGSGDGYSVLQIIEATRRILDRPTFVPGLGPRREGDPAMLVASNRKAAKTLNWRPVRSLSDMIGDATVWHRSPRYRDTIRAKLGV